MLGGTWVAVATCNAMTIYLLKISDLQIFYPTSIITFIYCLLLALG